MAKFIIVVFIIAVVLADIITIGNCTLIGPGCPHHLYEPCNRRR